MRPRITMSCDTMLSNAPDHKAAKTFLEVVEGSISGWFVDAVPGRTMPGNCLG